MSALDDYKRRGGKGAEAIESVLRRNVLPELGGIGISIGRAIDGAAFMFKTPQALRDYLDVLAGAARSG